MKIKILQREDAPNPVTIEEIVQRLNARFTTQEQMEQRFATLCTEIAVEINATLREEGDEIVFDCTISNWMHQQGQRERTMPTLRPEKLAEEARLTPTHA